MKTLARLVAGVGIAAALAAILIPLDKPFLASDAEMIVMAGEDRLAIIPPGTELAVNECRDINKMIDAIVQIGDREGVVTGGDIRVRWERKALIQGGRLSCQRW